MLSATKNYLRPESAPLKDLTAIVNDCLENGVFPHQLKLAAVSPVFKGVSLDKENYRPANYRPSLHQNFDLFLAVLGRNSISNTLFYKLWKSEKNISIKETELT